MKSTHQTFVANSDQLRGGHKTQNARCANPVGLPLVAESYNTYCMLGHVICGSLTVRVSYAHNYKLKIP